MKRTHLSLFVVLACLEIGAANASADTPPGAAAVAPGAFHTCVLTTAGGVQCWGDNEVGALGNGTTTNSSTPVPVSGLSSGVAAVSAGGFHTCALTAAGAVLCWGNNADSELGDGTTTDRLTPTPVSGLSSGVVAISAGTYHTCALTSSGGVRCWGFNGYGELGDGTNVERLTPVSVSGLSSGVANVAAGGYHTCAVTLGGAVRCWGLGGAGQNGSATGLDAWTPTNVAGLTSVAGVVAGYEHTCALTSAGAVQCWGYNGYGQLGDGSRTTTASPVAVSGLSSGVKAITAGGLHTCALTVAGVMKCWGDNEWGQIGDGTTTSPTLPEPVAANARNFTAIAGGYEHTCAVTMAGGVRCWGHNQAGQVGGGTLPLEMTAVAVFGFVGTGPMATTADASGVEPTSVTLNGMVSPDGEPTTAWFEYGMTSSYGSATPELNLPAGTTDVAVSAPLSGLTCGTVYHFRVVASNASGKASAADAILTTASCNLPAGRAAVATSGSHTCALTEAGAVWCWGLNTDGQLGDGTSMNRSTPVLVTGLSSGIMAVAAGGSHTCALTTGGRVLCWGDNSHGELGDGTLADRHTPVAVSGLASGVVAIAAGVYHTCAVKASGAAYCWGSNVFAQLGDGTETNRVTPVEVSGLFDVAMIAAGYSHTCAVTSAGAAWCWGANTGGALGDGTSTERLTPVTVSGFASGARAIATGDYYSCALTTGDAVQCWGTNDAGQLGDGTTTNQPTPVAVSGLSAGVAGVALGGSYGCARTSVGGVLCWPTGGVKTPVAVTGLPTNVKAISIGTGAACVVTLGETVWCWGANNYGQLGDGTTAERLTPVPAIGFGATTPTSVTGSASPVSLTSVVLNGTVNPNGLPTTAWFEYGALDTYPPATAAQSVGAGTTPVTVSATVSGLICGSGYWFRVAATNDSGTLYGDRSYFTISGCPPLTLTAITPSYGYMAGGTLVRLTGTGFEIGTHVILGDTGTYNVTVVSSTEIRATTYGRSPGLVDVVVMLPGGQTATLPQAYQFQAVVPADIGGAGKSDLAVFRPSTGEWWVRGQAGAVAFGQAGDIPVVADYNGDGKAELAVFRPSTSEWIVKDQAPVVFGQAGDVPVPGDYDGDGRAEMAVFRPSTGEWLIEGQDEPTTWGMRGDIPVPGDYNGDGVTERAVFRPTTGTWYVEGGQTKQWGTWGDVPVPADYNGDGHTELAVYRPSTGWWYVANGLTAHWGSPGDVPVPLDTKGYGRADFVVYRPSNGTWYAVDPYTPTATMTMEWGQAGDVPVGQPPQLPARPALKTAGDFDHDGSADITAFRPSTGGWYTLQSTHAYREYVGVTLGQAGDVPVPGDYLGTGNQERAVYRPSTGQWLLEDGRTFTLGAPDDVPVPGDYDGDGVTDIAVFTPGTGLWSILTGASGFTTLVAGVWGAPGDVPAPGDYDGDGKMDFAVFTTATGVWSIRSSLTGTTLVTVPFGMSGDIPVPGDYDGDGKTDIAVYRPSTGYWYVLTSSSTWSNWQWYWWGAVGDVPVSGDFDGDGVTDVAVYRPSTGTWYVMDVMTIVGWGEIDDVPVLGRQ